MNAGIRPAHEDGEPCQHGNRDAARLAAIDLEAAHRFLEHMAGGEPLTFQTFDDSNAKRRGLTRVFQGSFDEHARALGSLNDSGAGVFWMVNRGDGQGRRTQNILEVRALFLDLDGVALRPVLDTGVDPHAVVESSPGKWHVYWLVTGCPLSQFKPAQVALAARFGGDRTVIDLPRVLRVPGFLHRKGVPFQSRIERLVTAPPLDFETLVERLGLDIGGDDHLALPRVGTSTGEVGKVMTGRRHEHLRRRLTDFNWRGIPSEGIRASLHQINENECEPPKSRDEVDALLDDWLVRYAHQHGQDESQRGEPIDAEAQHFSVVPFADLEHNQPDPPVYWWDGYLPAGVVTLLGAHGGTGKSMMALMVCVSIALGKPLFGVPTRRGKAAYFSGEDGAQLIRYRLHWICDQLGVSVAELDSCLHILDATAGDPTLFRDAGAGGRRRGETTPTYETLRAYIEDHEIDVLVVDNASDTFDASEIDRARVRAFVRSLARIAPNREPAVLLLAHIDKASARGDRSHSEGYSGSTAWHNSARSRLFLSREKDDSLTLDHQKHNLAGRPREPLRLLWPDGGLPQPDEVLSDGLKGASIGTHTTALLKLIQEFYARGEFVATDPRSRNNAAKMLSDETGYPKRKPAEVFRMLRDAERSGLVVRETYKDRNRKERERWCLTPEGQRSIGPEPRARSAPSAADGALADTAQRDALSAPSAPSTGDGAHVHTGPPGAPGAPGGVLGVRGNGARTEAVETASPKHSPMARPKVIDSSPREDRGKSDGNENHSR